MSFIAEGLDTLGGWLGFDTEEDRYNKAFKRQAGEYKQNSKLGRWDRDQNTDAYGVFGNRQLTGLSDSYLGDMMRSRDLTGSLEDRHADFQGIADRAGGYADKARIGTLDHLYDEGPGGFASQQHGFARKMGDAQARGAGLAGETNQSNFSDKIAGLAYNLGTESGGMGSMFGKALGQGAGAGYSQAAQIGSQAAQSNLRNQMAADQNIFNAFEKGKGASERDALSEMDFRDYAGQAALSNWGDILPYAKQAGSVHS
jgi:hypothetical protein